MKTYEVEIVGLTPVLMHCDNIDWADAMTEWRNDQKNTGKSKAGDDRTPPWRWLGYVYHNGEYLVIPTDNLSRALAQGAVRVPTGITRGQGPQSYKEPSQQSIAFPEESWVLKINGGQTIRKSDIWALKDDEFSFSDQCKAVVDLGFTLSVKRAGVQGRKHVRVRPRFEDWSASGVIKVDEDEISKEILREIWRQAGKKGVLDWRPGSPKSPGSFGMFEAKIKG